MRSIAEHQQTVRELLTGALDSPALETVPLDQALGRFLGHDVLAPINLPGFDNSQMDGYAVGPPGDSPGLYRVLPVIPAGSADMSRLGCGEAAPIMTGAAIPSGAVAVVPVENARPSSFLPPGETVRLPRAERGEFIRKRGGDISAGQLALHKGARLSAPRLGLLAALGLPQVKVRRQLRIGVLSTGDELVPACADKMTVAPLPPGAIYDSNTPMLCAALVDAGAQAYALPGVSDTPDLLRESLRTLPPLDVLVSTGGVSQGAFEVVRQAFPEVEFTSVAMQPGGPQGLGTLFRQEAGAGAASLLPLLAFPGNPVSAMVSFEVFLRPLIAGPRPVLRLPLLEEARSPETKHQLRRARLHPEGVELLGGASSHLLHALAEADALVHLPVGLAYAAEGTEVEVWPL